MKTSDKHHYWRGKAMSRIAKSSPGFTLVEMAIVLLIIGLTATMFLQVSSATRDAQNRLLVRTKLTNIDTALANFVARNQRLPCPADGAIPAANPGAGIEKFNAAGACLPANNQTDGVIPWATLNLTLADATDPWNAIFTYRVDPQLAGAAPTKPLLMNMSYCDPAGTGFTATAPANYFGACATPLTTPTRPTFCLTTPANCTSPTHFLNGKGLNVSDTINAVPLNAIANGTGAAYVLISHGPNGTGAHNSNGGVVQPANGTTGPNEVFNENGNVLRVPPLAYNDAPLNDVAVPPALLHFDDYLSHPTILAVLNAANLGPRAN